MANILCTKGTRREGCISYIYLKSCTCNCILYGPLINSWNLKYIHRAWSTNSRRRIVSYKNIVNIAKYCKHKIVYFVKCFTNPTDWSKKQSFHAYSCKIKFAITWKQLYLIKSRSGEKNSCFFNLMRFGVMLKEIFLSCMSTAWAQRKHWERWQNKMIKKRIFSVINMIITRVNITSVHYISRYVKQYYIWILSLL